MRKFIFTLAICSSFFTVAYAQNTKTTRTKRDAIGTFTTKKGVSKLSTLKVTEVNDTTKVFDVVEQMPQYPGGVDALIEYLSANVQYPRSAQLLGQEGRALVSFVVEKDGSITEVEICKTSGSGILDKEAIRVISVMPKWIPGRQSGKPIRVKYNVPISFKLPKPQDGK